MFLFRRVKNMLKFKRLYAFGTVKYLNCFRTVIISVSCWKQQYTSSVGKNFLFKCQFQIWSFSTHVISCGKRAFQPPKSAWTFWKSGSFRLFLRIISLDPTTVQISSSSRTTLEYLYVIREWVTYLNMFNIKCI